MKKLPFIIFLDVDGVFNCQLFYRERKKRWDKQGYPIKETDLQHYENQLCKERKRW